MNTVMIFVHLLAAIVAVGGMHYVMGVLTPAARRLGDPHGAELMEAAARRFRPVVWVSVVLLLLSGLHLLFARPHLGSEHAPMLLLKIVLAMVVFGISLALTLPLKAFEGIQRKSRLWMRVNLFVALLVIFVAAYLLGVRPVPVPA